jgi:hypothetical protein
MGKAAYAIGTIVILACAFIGIKQLISVVAQTTIDAVVGMFTAPIRGRQVDRF